MKEKDKEKENCNYRKNLELILHPLLIRSPEKTTRVQVNIILLLLVGK